MDKFMKFWGKYGYMFQLGAAILSFMGGDILLGITNTMLAIPLFIAAKTKSYE